MSKLSIVISAYNEEKKIAVCLQSAKFADEIIVIDNSSTDNTKSVAKKFTPHVFIQKNDPSKIDLQKNFGIEKATGEWILILDADEEITPELQREILDVVKSSSESVEDAIAGYLIPRKNIIFGKWIEHTGWYPDYQLRLFKKGKGKYEKQHYHEQISLVGKTAYLQQHITHYNYETISQCLQKNFFIYAQNEAENHVKNGYVFNYKDAIGFPLKEFLSRYFAREGYKDGVHGLVLSLIMTASQFVVFCYLWEKKKFVEKQISFYHINKILVKSHKEIMFWVYEKRIEIEPNWFKKVFYKIAKRMRL